MSEATAFPLSFSQKRLWLVDQMDPDGSQYAMPLALDLLGTLDTACLSRVLNAIVARHEILRTTFVVIEDDAYQLVRDQADLPLHEHDLQGRVDGAETAEKLMLDWSLQSFDLKKGPLVYAHLIRLTPQSHILFINMHHIISDGWSLGVFYRELIALYGAYKNGEPSPLAELEVQYADFTDWQQEWFDTGGMDDQLHGWRKALAQAPFLLPLPADYPRPPTQTFRGKSVTAQWDTDLSNTANSLARTWRTTPFIVLMASYAVLLAKYSGQEDLLIGTPIANRNRIEVEPLIGFFVNTLPMRANLTQSPSFKDLVLRVHDHAMEAYRNQDLPFEKLVEELNPERDLSHSPIFQVLFTLESGDLQAVTTAGVKFRPRTIDNGTCKFDLGLSLSVSEVGLSANLRFNTALYEEERATRLLEHYHKLTTSLFQNPETSIWNHETLTPAEKAQLLTFSAEYARTGPPVHQQFEARVLAQPDALALADPQGSLTYDETNRAANRLARYLREQGLQDEDPCAICMEPSVEMFVAILAVLKAGGAYLPMDPKYPADRLAYMLRDMQDPILLTQTRLLPLLPESSGKVIATDQENQVMPHQDDNLNRPVSMQQLAYVIYTSGSTGQPKGVELPHGGLASLVAWHLRSFQVTPADRSAQFAGPAFDAAVWSLWPYLAVGASVHVPDEIMRVSVHEVPTWLKDHGITLCFLPTPLAEAMLHVEEPEGLAVRCILTGGDKLTQNPAADTSFQLVNNYGPTEGTVVTTSWPLCHDEVTPPPIGIAIDNNRTYILDKRAILLPMGIPGELFVGGATLARGYHGRPAMTAERFVPDPMGIEPGARMYRTGDRVKRDPRGCLLFLGRTDFQVKLRGFRIELGEIESALLEYGEVSEVICLLREDRPGDKRLVAYCVGGSQDNTPALVEYLKERLPDYMVPSSFINLERMPLTANGKIDRDALPAPDPSQTGSTHAFVAASNDMEHGLTAIWQEVLGVENIGVKDNFFDLGGHSMLMTQVQRRIKETLSQDLGMVVLFRHPTIQGLASYLGGASDEGKAAQTGRDRAQKQKEALLKRKGNPKARMK